MSLRLLAAPTAFIAAAAASAALACSCIGYADAATQLAEARLMVVARAEWTKPERGATDPGQKVTRFRVLRTIKAKGAALGRSRTTSKGLPAVSYSSRVRSTSSSLALGRAG